mgnify:FL=1
MEHDNYCAITGEWSWADWMVEVVEICGIEGTLVFPANHPPTKGGYAQHCLIYKVQEKKSYNVYKIEEGEICEILQFTPEK